MMRAQRLGNHILYPVTSSFFFDHVFFSTSRYVNFSSQTFEIQSETRIEARRQNQYFAEPLPNFKYVHNVVRGA